VRISSLLFIILLLVSCGEKTSCPGDGQPSRWTLPDDKMSLAILIVHYETYAFEGGVLSHFELCHSCDTDSIPLEVQIDNRGDSRFIAFVYTETGDTVWHSVEAWNGLGTIFYPDSFLPTAEFRNLERAQVLPLDLEYLYPRGTPPSHVLERIEQAWDAVSMLDIVDAFADRPWRVGVFLYAPAVGAFEPSFAKWMFVLYRGETSRQASSV
jgi:hypothetical protein